MRPPKTLLKFITAPLTCSILLGIAYLTLALLLPPSPMTMKAYNFTPAEYHSMLFVVALPSVLIWSAAFAGYGKLREYASIMAGSEQGSYIRELAQGAAWLAWSLPVPAIAALLLNSAAYHRPDWQAAAMIITNYITLLLPLTAFLLIGKATHHLVSHLQLKFKWSDARLLFLFFVMAGAAYCFFTFRQIDTSSLTASDNAYYLPVWLLTLTIIIPYLYTWFVGLLAAYEASLISQKSDGIIYRQALTWLAGGIVIVIGSSIVLQYLTTVQPRRGYLMLSPTLILSQIIRIVWGGGFIVMALGAIKLKRIEEI